VTDVLNGVDASYAVVEGDWGLGKGVHVTPTVYGGRYIDAAPHVGHYYPSAVTGPATGVSKSSRRPTASCRSRRRAITSHGRRNPRRSRRSPKCRFIRRRSSSRRRTACRGISPARRRTFSTENPGNCPTKSTPIKKPIHRRK
jgi:hypothetical protein